MARLLFNSKKKSLSFGLKQKQTLAKHDGRMRIFNGKAIPYKKVKGQTYELNKTYMAASVHYTKARDSNVELFLSRN